MFEGKLSVFDNSLDRQECAKRKLSYTENEADSGYKTESSKKLKRSLLANDLFQPKIQNDNSVMYFKSTKAYTKVVARPDLLPSMPKIFQFNEADERGSNTSDDFLVDLLTANNFNTGVKKRFTNIMFNEIKTNKSKIKMKKQRISEENCESSIINKEEGEKEKKENEKKEKQKKENKKEEKEKKENKKKEKEKMKEEVMKPSGLNETNISPVGEVEDRTKEGVIKKVDLYRAVNKNGFIFHMPHPSKFSFHGEVKVTIISGEVEILGYTLNSSSARTSVDVFSPNFYMPLTIQTKPVNQNRGLHELKSTLKEFLTKFVSNELLQRLQPNDCVLFIEEVVSTFGIVLNKYFEKQLFPKDLEDVKSANNTLKTLQSIFTFKKAKKGKYFIKNPWWDRIPLGRCTTLCGGKGVGKSTLLRYYLNKLVSTGERVLCVDLDPGQPEFAFPGCVSAVIVDQPLLGPNFTHIIEPVVMTYFGDIDVSLNPNKYLECIKYVIETCKQSEELSELRWFVNTMGFCKGLGVNLMITVLKLLNPDRVIQIKSLDQRNNYPFYLTPLNLNSKSGYTSMNLDNVSLSHDLRVIYSSAERENIQLKGGLKTRELRDVMAISYFSRMVSPPFYNFNAVQPYLISFSKLYLEIDFLIHPNDVLRAFNGNTVSLSHFEPDDEEIFSVPERDDYFKVVVKPKVRPSLGMGFVRGIDCKEKRFYVITHLPVETLNRVNCLGLGKVYPPYSMFLRQNSVEGETVYTTHGELGVFRHVKRMFRLQGPILNTESKRSI